MTVFTFTADYGKICRGRGHIVSPRAQLIYGLAHKILQLAYHAIVEIPFKNSRIRIMIRISTKIEWFVAGETSHCVTRNSADADKPRDAFRGQSRSPNIVPFHMLGMVSC